MRISALVLPSLLSLTLAQYFDDNLYILIDEVSVYSCRGVKNEIKISEEDVSIVNAKGNKAYYIRAPGNYSLHFKNLNVQKDFGFLAGEIGVTLQVPIIEGPAGMRFDLPYPMIPETGLLSQKCDAHSGIVERNGRQYCRYCDLCAVEQAVESTINREHVFLPNSRDDIVPEQKCGAVSADSYEFRKQISLPGRAALEKMVKAKAGGLDEQITKRLNKGQGRFQVFLNLIAAAKPSMSQAAYFSSKAECKCCVPGMLGCDSYAYMYCDMEDCKSSWAHQCLHNTARIAACFTVEFNYRMTTQYAEVMDFLRENNYPNQEIEYGRREPVATQPPTQPPRRQYRPTRPPTPPPEMGAPEESLDESFPLNERCVALMPKKMTHLRRYCTIFWNAQLCCPHCAGVCPEE